MHFPVDTTQHPTYKRNMGMLRVVNANRLRKRQAERGNSPRWRTRRKSKVVKQAGRSVRGGSTCTCGLIWKKGLRGCNHVNVRSQRNRVGSTPTGLVSLHEEEKKQITGKTQRKAGHVSTEAGTGAALSPATVGAPEAGRGQGSLLLHRLCGDVDLRPLGSRTVRQYFPVV